MEQRLLQLLTNFVVRIGIKNSMDSATSSRLRSGLSLVEMIVALAILGILTGVAIPIYGNTRSSALAHAAITELEWLNEALVLYRLTVGIPTNPADDGSIINAQSVINLLIAETPPSGLKVVGFPFLKPTPVLKFVSSSDLGYRYRWNGVGFVLLEVREEQSLKWTGKEKGGFKEVDEGALTDGFTLKH